IPIVEADEVTWLVKFYFKKAQHIRPEELTLAEGLGQLMSHQLSIVAAEKLTAHMRDAELRNLQAQINPHFLFNTLHKKCGLICACKLDRKSTRLNSSHVSISYAV